MQGHGWGENVAKLEAALPAPPGAPAAHLPLAAGGRGEEAEGGRGEEQEGDQGDQAPALPSPALPSKSVTTSPHLVTVSRAVEIAALASFQEGCRNYVLGLKGGGAKEAA